MIKRILPILLLLPISSWAFESGFYSGTGVGVDAVDFYQWAHLQIISQNVNVIIV